MLCVLTMGRFVSKNWAIVSLRGGVLSMARKSQDLYIDAGLTKPTGKLSVAQAVCKLQTSDGESANEALCALKDGEWYVAVDTFCNNKGQADFYWAKISETNYLLKPNDAIANLNKVFGLESEPKKPSKKIDWYWNLGSNAGVAAKELQNDLDIIPQDIHYWLEEDGSLGYGESRDLENGFSVVKHTEEDWLWLELTECGTQILNFNYGSEPYAIDLEWIEQDSDVLFYKQIEKNRKGKS